MIPYGEILCEYELIKVVYKLVGSSTVVITKYVVSTDMEAAMNKVKVLNESPIVFIEVKATHRKVWA